MTDETLAIWFTPECIRDHFADDEALDENRNIVPSALAAWVKQATDEQLETLGHAAIYDDRVWDAFHNVLADYIREKLD